MVVEGDGSEQFGQRNAEAVRNFPDSLIRNKLVSIVVGVQGGQQRCRLADPIVDESAVACREISGSRHVQPVAGVGDRRLC